MPFGKVVLFKKWKSKRDEGIYRVLNPSLKKKERKKRKRKRLCREIVEAGVCIFRVCMSPD